MPAQQHSQGSTSGRPLALKPHEQYPITVTRALTPDMELKDVLSTLGIWAVGQYQDDVRFLLPYTFLQGVKENMRAVVNFLRR